MGPFSVFLNAIESPIVGVRRRRQVQRHDQHQGALQEAPRREGRREERRARGLPANSGRKRPRLPRVHSQQEPKNRGVYEPRGDDDSIGPENFPETRIFPNQYYQKLASD